MSDPSIPILVVDDDLATRLLASEALHAAGFAPLEAEDGREALEQYDRRSPEAILLDINMPGLDGYEICRRIRMRPGGVATSIMVMTATDDVDAVQRAFAAGATDFLTKPLNLPLLAHRVRYMLRAAATARDAQAAASRLTRAQRLARMAHWQLDGEGRLTWARDSLAVFWPDAPDELRSNSHPLSYVHPEDRAEVEALLESRSAHQIDFRLQFPDGTESVVHQDAELDITDRGVVLIGATQDVSAMKFAEQQIAQLAFYDDVTGIPNRQLAERYVRYADPVVPRSAIAIELGIARFDRLSVGQRDALIRAATARVIERVRGADLEVRLDQAPRPIERLGATLVARTDPDELLVVTSAPVGGSGAAAALQIADALAAPFVVTGRELLLQPRIGAADYPDPVADLLRIDSDARAVMCDAERTPPRNVVVLSAAARELRTRRAVLGTDLGRTLDAVAAGLGPSGELSVEYSPRVEMLSRRVFGVRARPRWIPALADPQALPLILAGDPGLRERLASWTLGQACRDAAGWLASGIAVRLAVELPIALPGAPGFAEEVQHLLVEAGVEPLLIDLELVPAAAPSSDDELDRTAAALHGLRALGPRIALTSVDDRCSVRDLRRLPIDGLVVERLTLDRIGPGLLATIAQLARGLELRLAIAGVDSPAALAALDRYEPNELAGGLFGAAVPASLVAELVQAPVGQQDWPLPTHGAVEPARAVRE